MQNIQENTTRPVVGLAMAATFQETVAMDLKLYCGIIYYISLTIALDYLHQPLL